MIQKRKKHVDEYFEPDVIENAKAANIMSRERLIYMLPDDFLALARTGRGKEKTERVRDMVAEGQRFPDLPYLWIDTVRKVNQDFDRRITKDECQIIGHEGRHRTRALKALGYTRVPVIIKSTNDLGIQWHKSKKRPKLVKTEDGYNRYHFTDVFDEEAQG